MYHSITEMAQVIRVMNQKVNKLQVLEMKQITDPNEFIQAEMDFLIADLQAMALQIAYDRGKKSEKTP